MALTASAAVAGSSPGPTWIFFATSETASTTRSKIDLCTNNLEPAVQHCPWLKKMPFAAPTAAASTSASANTT